MFSDVRLTDLRRGSEIARYWIQLRAKGVLQRRRSQSPVSWRKPLRGSSFSVDLFSNPSVTAGESTILVYQETVSSFGCDGRRAAEVSHLGGFRRAAVTRLARFDITSPFLK